MPATDQHLRKHLCRQAERRGLDLSAAQVDALMGYLELVLQAQARLNLTGLRRPPNASSTCSSSNRSISAAPT